MFQKFPTFSNCRAIKFIHIFQCKFQKINMECWWHKVLNPNERDWPWTFLRKCYWQVLFIKDSTKICGFMIFGTQLN